MARSVWRNRHLLASLTRREVVGRYRGSMLGMLWSFFNPLFMLAVYTFAFGVIFQARWNAASDSTMEFAVVLFVGLLVFNLFAECISRAPNLILSNVSYVKKVVFPLEILPYVILGGALFHLLISFAVWLLFHLVFIGWPPVTALLLPLVLLPLVLFTLGVSWLLAALGVYLRDVGHVVGVAILALMFLSAIFYPVEAIPEAIRGYMMLNPLLYVIEQARQVLMWGNLPIMWHWILALAGGALAAWGGFAVFQRTRKGFADVL